MILNLKKKTLKFKKNDIVNPSVSISGRMMNYILWTIVVCP